MEKPHFVYIEHKFITQTLARITTVTGIQILDQHNHSYLYPNFGQSNCSNWHPK